MRFPVSGVATQAVPLNTSTGATGITTVHSITSGHVFWCRGIAVNNTGSAGTLEVYDATAQTTATGQDIAALIDMGPSPTASAATPAKVIGYPAPGLKFSNNYVLVRMAATQTIAIGGVSVFGYEE